MDGENEIKRAYESILSHDFERAIDWFEQAVARNPGNAGYHYKLSITYARSGKLANSLEHAVNAARLDAANEEYRLHLQNVRAMELVQQAEALLRQSDEQADRSVALLKRAIALDPLNVGAHLLLAVSEQLRGKLAEAVASVQEALKLDPQHGLAQKLLAEYAGQLQNTLKSSNEKGT